MPEYTIRPARYAKRKLVIQCRPGVDAWKTRAMRLADCLGRWVHRYGGYVMSPSAARRFERLYAEGWDGSIFNQLQSPAELAGDT